jgi:peptidoglycan/xylan/chitin deacetylase (PgdA/CDA1 family)
MKKMPGKIFTNVVVNAVLLVLLTGVFCAGFAFNPLSSVFDEDGYKPIYNGDRNYKNVSIMINVYGGTEFLPRILSTLEEYQAKATFFVGGCWVAKNDESFLKLVMAGHEIGNHGYFHKDHAKLDYDGNYNEIVVTHKVVKELVGVEMKLFAPPSGSFNNATLKVAKGLNYATIMWSKDTIDWRDHDENIIFTRATKNLKNGDFILMHPTEQTAGALAKILAFYKRNGFNIVTVSQNIKGDTA